jgi:hypothetical protein
MQKGVSRPDLPEILLDVQRLPFNDKQKQKASIGFSLILGFLILP